MVKKIFWKNPYLTELQTKVSGVNGNEITLEKTIFYAFSGGQESDTGTVGEYSVLEARKQGQEIIYILEDGHLLHQGDEVFVKIDWNRRYRLMRLHFAAEIILELACKSLKGIEKIGAHIAEDKARIDFLWGDNISKSFPVLEAAANELIAAGHEIISAFSDESNERRYWEINGFAKVPCGGTHLKTTNEVGRLRLKRSNLGKGKERIEIYLVD